MGSQQHHTDLGLSQGSVDDLGVVLQRRHSTTDLFALRRWETRREHRDNVNTHTEHTHTPSRTLMGEEEARRLLDVLRVATERRSLPQFRRTQQQLEGETTSGSLRRSSRACMNIDPRTVPCFVNDSVSHLPGVRLPLAPQYALDTHDNQPTNLTEPHPTARRPLPVWQPVLTSQEQRINAQLQRHMYTAYLPSTPAKARSAAAEAPGLQVGARGLQALVRGMLGQQARRRTWYEKYAQTGQASTLLTVIAWDNTPKEVPGGLKVMCLRGDEEQGQGLRVRFNDRATRVSETFGASEYDRTPIHVPPFTLDDLAALRNEMIVYKIEEMAVHPTSRQHTHVYRRFN